MLEGWLEYHRATLLAKPCPSRTGGKPRGRAPLCPGRGLTWAMPLAGPGEE
jgi:hypothetical protein